MTETETPLEVKEPEKTLAELRMEFAGLYKDVAEGSEEHIALIHLIAYETTKHDVVEGQKRLARAQEDVAEMRSTPDVKRADVDLFIGIENSERNYVDKKHEASDAIQTIMALHTGPEYQAKSRATAGIMEQLEKRYIKDGADKPFAAVALAAREVNERVVLKRDKPRT